MGSRHAFKGTFIWESSANGSALRHTIKSSMVFSYSVRHIKQGDDVIRIVSKAVLARSILFHPILIASKGSVHSQVNDVL